jgi:cell fate regulator YaaT (PSP1 superfamily)
MMVEKLVIGIQFNPVGKVYDFALPDGEMVQVGDIVLVSTSRGRQLGQVVRIRIRQIDETSEIQLIERIANEDDLAVWEANKLRERDTVEKIRAYFKDQHIEGVKVLSADYSFDGNRMTLYLNYEPNQDFDLRSFIRDISKDFSDTHIEVRQIGPRDVAKAVSGLGACGIEKRCCSRFLTNFSSISIKMAKSQDISLTPMEITGMCGRLRCCLAYEYDTYEEARKNLPKRKKVIQTPLGEGRVVQVLPLSNSVVVDMPEKGPRQFTLEELQSGKLSDNSPVEVPLPQVEVFEEGDVELLNFREPVHSSEEKSQHGRKSDRSRQQSSNRQARSQRRRSGQNQKQNKGASQQKQNKPPHSGNQNQGNDK